MRSRVGKKLLRGALQVLPVSIVPLDYLLRLSQRLTSAIAGLLFVRDWQLEACGRPQFFKHEINLSRWPSEPARWAFTARGVYARENMFRGCKVLDLCCGDGSYSYLFFSDIAGRIDSVDSDSHAIGYAKRYHASATIAYHRSDIVSQPLPSRDYDVVVWNAAICYFTEEEIRIVLSKIIASARPSVTLSGMLPKANAWIDHKTEFTDAASVEAFLRQYFAVVSIREIDEGSANTFYFQASAPLNSGDPA